MARWPVVRRRPVPILAMALAVGLAAAACGPAATPSPSPTLIPRPTPTRAAAPAVATARPTPTRAPTPAVSPGPTGQAYSVQKGDTLVGIAAKFGVTLDALRAANPQVTDPTRLQIGQVLVIPSK